MSLFLNGVETNTVMLNGVETTGFFNGNMVWGYNPPSSGLVFQDSTERTTGTVMSNKEVPSGSYIALCYQHKGSSNNGASQSVIYYNNDTNYYSNKNWCRRHHSVVGNYCILVNYIAFNKANNSVANRETNNYWYTTNYNHTSYHKFKVVAEKSTGRCSAFVENVYMGYGQLNKTNLSSVGIFQNKEATDTPYCKDINVAWFNSISDAADWNP